MCEDILGSIPRWQRRTHLETILQRGRRACHHSKSFKPEGLLFLPRNKKRKKTNNLFQRPFLLYRNSMYFLGGGYQPLQVARPQRSTPPSYTLIHHVQMARASPMPPGPRLIASQARATENIVCGVRKIKVRLGCHKAPLKEFLDGGGCND